MDILNAALTIETLEFKANQTMCARVYLREWICSNRLYRRVWLLYLAFTYDS